MENETTAVLRTAMYDASREQVECWHYHNNLSSDHHHQVITVDEVLEDLDIPAIEKAIATMIRRHESLRTCFPLIDGQVMQCITDYDAQLFAPVFHDLRQVENFEEEIKKIVHSWKLRLRQMDIPPLIHSGIFRVPDGRYYICICLHHLISDTWSASVIRRELAMLYDLFRNGRAVSVPPPVMQLKDYAFWQKKWLEENGAAARQYWAARLGPLGTSFHTTGGIMMTREEQTDLLNDCKAGSFIYLIFQQQYRQLLRLSDESKAPAGAIMNASLQLLFHLLTGREQVIIAMPVINRFLPGSQQVIGCLGGATYLCLPIATDLSVRDFVRAVYADFLESARYLIYSYPEMDLDGNLLRLQSDLYVNFSSREMSGANSLDPRMDGRNEIIQGDTAYYALSCYVSECRDGMMNNWKYNVRVYTPEQIRSMADKHKTILRMMCEDPARTVAELMAAEALKKGI